MRARHADPLLPDVARGELGLLHLQRDGIVEVALGDPADLRRQRGREQGDLAGGRRRREHALDLVEEAHAQHLVGLVEDEDLKRRQVERAPVEVVEDAAGGAHDDGGAGAQRVELRAVGRAAVDGDDGDPQPARQLGHRLGGLQGELAGGGEHQRAHAAAALADPVEQRQGERRGLAGARAGAAQHVAAGEERRQGGGLDGGRLDEAERVDGVDQARVQGVPGARGVGRGVFGGLGVHRGSRGAPSLGR
ncbi:MAG: hypothetical protein R3F59_35280 [Myxococcota bacterium]